MFCDVVLGVLDSLAIILLRKRELVALLYCGCVLCLFLRVPLFCLQTVIAAFPGHTHF